MKNLLFIIIVLQFSLNIFSQEKFNYSDDTSKKKYFGFALSSGLISLNFDEMNEILELANLEKIENVISLTGINIYIGDPSKDKYFIVIDSKIGNFEKKNINTKIITRFIYSDFVFNFNYNLKTINKHCFSSSFGVGLNSLNLSLIDGSNAVNTFQNSVQSLTGEKNLNAANISLHLKANYDKFFNLFQRNFLFGLSLGYQYQIFSTGWGERGYALEEEPNTNINGFYGDLKIALFF